MIGRSFRVRLAVWNAAVLAWVFVVVGGTLTFCDHFGMMHAVDRELAERADRIIAVGYPHGWWLTAAPAGFGTASGTRAADRALRAVAWISGAGSEPAGGGLDADAQRAAAFRRPRFLNLRGECVGPWSALGAWDPATARPSTQPIYTTLEGPGDRVRVLSLPLKRTGAIIGELQVARDLADFDRVRGIQVRQLFLMLPAALLLSGLGALFLTDRGLQPVREVARAAAEIGVGDLSRRLAVSGKDELAQLAMTFNGMLGRLEDAFRKLETVNRELQSGFERQKRFTADASHELRTPLTRIKGTASLALSGLQPPEAYRRALEAVDESADVMVRLLQDLLLLARADAGQLRVRFEPVELAGLLRQACELLPPEAARRVVAEPGEPGVRARGDRESLRRVLLNLLVNAVRHTPPGGGVALRVLAEAERVVVTVADQGEGIAPEHLPHVFERFYRADESRDRQHGGTGLGLAICKSIVEAHGGRIRIESTVGVGTIVYVELPRDTAGELSADQNAAPGPDLG